MTVPPRVVHVGYQRNDNLRAIAADTAVALHMGKGEKALLMYYAAQSSGFRPALQAIANATGQNRSQIWRNRAALERDGLVLLRDGQLIIDWNHAKIFASLDPEMTSKHCVIAPALSPVPWKDQRVSALEMKYGDFETLIPKLANLSEEEYATLKNRFKRNKNNEREEKAS